MSQLPLVVRLAAAGAALLLLGLCAATAYAVLHAAGRRRVAGWSMRRVLVLAVAALLPWLVVWFAPLHIEVNIHGLGPLLGWLLLALVAFALLVLLPLGALLSGVVWWVAWRRRRSIP
ncbi:MAG TPA: hypothetical protein VFK13_05420 [Gemmatimonadaceae bacterium]|nr:hypothetical protein [Gemmatimonadaceae bacterium]